MPTTERDTQRGKAYRAERHAFDHGDPAHPWTIERCQRYADLVTGSAWFARQWPKAAARIALDRGVWVKAGRNGGRAAIGRVHDPDQRRYRQRISLGVWARRDWVVLHELAHVVTQIEHGTHVAGHGWQWASIYLDLVRHHLGASCATMLRLGYRQEGVRYTAPRAKRTITPEHRAVLVERLAAARTRKAQP